MNFDLLLTIVFILFFVLGPLLRRFGGQQQQPPPGRRRPGPRPPTAGPIDPDSPMAKRIEEARRRVLEAMGEGQTEHAPETSREAAGRTAEQAPPQRPRPPQELDWQPSAVPSEPFLTPTPRLPAKRVRPEATGSEIVGRERRRGAKPARLSGRMPALGYRGIVNGMIWHEILSEPVSKRASRRQTSRLRSR